MVRGPYRIRSAFWVNAQDNFTPLVASLPLLCWHRAGEIGDDGSGGCMCPSIEAAAPKIELKAFLIIEKYRFGFVICFFEDRLFNLRPAILSARLNVLSQRDSS
jgi:hypothetical protein